MKPEAEEAPVGMLPDKSMARCEKCGDWSYMAAIGGRCLSCDMEGHDPS